MYTKKTMIKIAFPPGCYGHYLARCLYSFTNLRDGEFENFTFDQGGSSHSWRNHSKGRKKIHIGHKEYRAHKLFAETLYVQPHDKVVTILPTDGHWLDYLNNQLVKESKNNLFVHLDGIFDEQELQEKFDQQWGWTGHWRDAPPWMLREIFSFMIGDWLLLSYGTDYYAFREQIEIEAGDLFVDFEQAFSRLVLGLDLEINVSLETISTTSQTFINSQRFHGSQQRCERWVQDTISGLQSANPALTFFDEAYIQYFFRCQGFEMQCDGLDDLPAQSLSMQKLLYSK
jgi:hypothetical protein